jgi:nucleoside-diphosphate-sugar epimerase
VRGTYCDSYPEDLIKTYKQFDWARFNLLDESVDYAPLLNDIDVVVHLAGMTHVFNYGNSVLEKLKKTNIEGTKRLIVAAAKSGARHFVFLSTIKVYGEKTAYGTKLTESDIPAPADPYARSKLDAEQVIIETCGKEQIKYTILRPALVYGPGVKANFFQLMRMISKKVPLPLAAVHNLRSLLYVDNLCHAILACVSKTEAANKIYLISDVNISVPDLIRKIAFCLGIKPLLFPFPVLLLEVAGKLAGKQKYINRLVESLVIDNSRIMNELQWSPAISFDTGIKNTVEWYKKALSE